MTGRRAATALLATAAAIGSSWLAAEPAQAHGGSMYLSGSLGYGVWNSSHTSVSACDTKADGWGVRTWYITSNGVEDHVGDSNGASGGCGTESPTGGGTIVKLRVCAGPNGENRRCTGDYVPI